MATGPGRRADADIQRDVLDELNWDARMQPHEVAAVVSDGVVSLTGWVDSYARKWAAERDAHRVRGVRAVANDIEVRLPGQDGYADAEIALAVSRSLEWDSFVPADQLDVTVANGWVMLRGVVDWAYQRRAAEREVRRLRGVRGVTNLIEVRPRRRSGGDVAREIRRALARRTGGDRIRVTVEGHDVVLTGSVRSWRERNEAERVACSAPGVWSVDDRLTVTAE
ncbi:BON domain-containing protein [Micromonospora sp. CPCC 206060]|uniref:BON domain-containing protein n=1 Tax=Micromonospora sp. CPCC 206060 TaxID=3122406 RepID=UPI002FF09E8B